MREARGLSVFAPDSGCPSLGNLPEVNDRSLAGSGGWGYHGCMAMSVQHSAWPSTSSVNPPARPLPPASNAAACAEEVRGLLAFPTVAREERRILDVLEQCSPTVLNDVLRQVDLHRLVNAIDDHALGEKNRTELLSLLTEQQVGRLDVDVRAALVEGMQKGYTSRQEERAIRNIFVATHGAALVELETRIDSGGDAHDLEGLVFHDIGDASVRAEILGHIAGEAVPDAGLKVVSDIDDTFCSRLHDERYPKKTVYPGVRQLYHELDVADGRNGDVMFLTARPSEPTGFTENRTHATLRRQGAPEAAVVTGSFRGLVSLEGMAGAKHERLQRIQQLYPGHGEVLLGDSGQGDVRFARLAIGATPAAVRGALIHDVVGTPADERARLRDDGIILFDTYIDAAVEAHQLRLISRDAVHRVAAAAQRELGEIEFDSEAQRDARRAEFDRALERVDHLEASLGRDSRTAEASCHPSG